MTVPPSFKTDNVVIIIKTHWELTIYQSLKYKLPNMQFKMYNLMYIFSPQPVESVPSTMNSYSFVLTVGVNGSSYNLNQCFQASEAENE